MQVNNSHVLTHLLLEISPDHTTRDATEMIKRKRQKDTAVKRKLKKSNTYIKGVTHWRLNAIMVTGLERADSSEGYKRPVMGSNRGKCSIHIHGDLTTGLISFSRKGASSPAAH